MIPDSLSHKNGYSFGVTVVLLLVLSCFANAQGVQFTKRTHDFGQVANGFFQPAAFQFVNTGAEKIAILSVSAPYQVKSRYQRTFIQPGDTGMLYLTIETQQLGTFDETASVLFSHTNKPYRLRITGEIITVQACFPNHNNLRIREVRIVDGATQEKIHPSVADFYLNYQQKISVKTQRVGKTTADLPIGLYRIAASAQGYLPLDTVRFIRKSEPIVFIELQKDVRANRLALSPAQEPEPAHVPAVVVADTLSGLLAPDEQDSILLDVQKYADNNIVFLVDVSLSMKKNNKMDRVKRSLTVLVGALRPVDRVGLITYNNKPHLIAEGVSGTHKNLLRSAVDSLEPKGLTNGVAGLEMAYAIAKKNFSPTGNNQVILVTDGEFTGSQSKQELAKLVSEYSQQQIKLSIVSLGNSNEVQADLSKMAKKGNGNHIPVSASNLDFLLLQEIKQQSQIGTDR